MTRPAARGPGSNQHQDKPPVAPTEATGAASAVPTAAVLDDPFADGPPTPTDLGAAIRSQIAPSVQDEVGVIHRRAEALVAEAQAQDHLVDEWHLATRRAEEARDQVVNLIDRHVVAAGGQPIGRLVLPEQGPAIGDHRYLADHFERAGLSRQDAAALAEQPTVFMGIASVSGAMSAAESAERRVATNLSGLRQLADQTRTETERGRGRVRGFVHEQVRKAGAENGMNDSESLTAIYREAISDADRSLEEAHNYALRVARRTQDRQDEVELLLRRRGGIRA